MAESQRPTQMEPHIISSENKLTSVVYRHSYYYGHCPNLCCCHGPRDELMRSVNYMRLFLLYYIYHDTLFSLAGREMMSGSVHIFYYSVVPTIKLGE